MNLDCKKNFVQKLIIPYTHCTILMLSDGWLYDQI